MKNLTVRQHSTVAVCLHLLGAGVVLLGGGILESIGVMLSGIFIFIASLIYRLYFIRCPHCGDHWLGVKTMPDYCPKCGSKID